VGLLTALDTGDGPPPTEIVVVDDRRRPNRPLGLPGTTVPVRTLTSGGRGLVAARNLGWRSAGAEWIVFLSDDVVPAPDWSVQLAADLASLPGDVAVCQGAVRLPHTPEALADRTGLDVAYRRSALVMSRGFDERFRGAHRADEDLEVRLKSADLRLFRGGRQVILLIRPGGFWAAVGKQADHADDAVMRRVHGPGWRERTNAPPDRFTRHLWTCGAAVYVAAAAGLRPGRLRTARRVTGTAAALAWAGLTAELAAAAADPAASPGVRGSRAAAGALRVLVTSIAIPPVAVAHRLRGEIGVRRARLPLPAAVLFDRDGTLIGEPPHDGDVDGVVTARGAREALARLRDLGVPIGVLTNRPGTNGNGVLEPGVDAKVNDRLDALLGPFDVWEVCPHEPGEACGCRHPHPGLIRRAAASLGVAPEECVVIGDVGGDVAAARAAGARGILVPTPRTRAEEVAATAEVAADLIAAVELAVDGKRP
jgi:HAD superfamily hydrolase (TIGR01662 family)